MVWLRKSGLGSARYHRLRMDNKRPAGGVTVERRPHALENAGGDGRIRTDDPLRAKQVLSQLSYIPVTALYQAARGAVNHSQSHTIRRKSVPASTSLTYD